MVPVVWKRYTKPAWDQLKRQVRSSESLTFLLLSIAPNSSQGLLIRSGIPILSKVSWYLAGRPRQLTGSNKIKRFAPIRLIPQPPAFELRRKTKSVLSGSLNRSTILDRFGTLKDPSRRTQPYLHSISCVCDWTMNQTHFLFRHILSMRSRV